MSIHHPEIVVTSRIPPFLTTGLQEKYVVHERDHIRDRQVFGRVRALVGGGESKIDASYMALFPALEMISVCGVGYDGIDVAAAKKRGIMVSHTPEVLNDDVADLALGLLLAVARKIPAADRFTRNADWLDGPFPLTRKLTGAKLGIVGMGRIGQGIAKRAAHGFGMRVIYHNRSRLSTDLETACKATYVGKEELLRTADHVMLVVPYSAESHHTIGAKELSCMKPSATLVNIARGGIIDDAALANALAAGQIAAAGLDVFEGEAHLNPRFLALPNVLLQPHHASGTVETRRAMGQMMRDNLTAHFAGQPLLTPVI